jgi:hypothetical protein
MSSAFARRACVGMEVVLNLAAHVARIGYDSKYPGTSFTDNVTIGLNVLNQST